MTDLLLSVWREACRHCETGDSLASVAALLAGQLPSDLLLVVRLDEANGRMVNAAAAGPAAEAATTDHRPLTPAEMQRLEDWCRTGSVAHERAGTAGGVLAGLLPSGTEGDLLAGPLRDREQTLGAIVALARAPRAFDASHEQLLSELLEPVAVALHIDRRFREMTRLREALPGDNGALVGGAGDTHGRTSAAYLNHTALPPASTAASVTLDQAMIAHIEQALVACSGRIEGKQGAAAKLGINPHTLRARMRKFGIDWSRYRP